MVFNSPRVLRMILRIAMLAGIFLAWGARASAAGGPAAPGVALETLRSDVASDAQAELASALADEGVVVDSAISAHVARVASRIAALTDDIPVRELDPALARWIRWSFRDTISWHASQLAHEGADQLIPMIRWETQRRNAELGPWDTARTLARRAEMLSAAGRFEKSLLQMVTGRLSGSQRIVVEMERGGLEHDRFSTMSRELIQGTAGSRRGGSAPIRWSVGPNGDWAVASQIDNRLLLLSVARDLEVEEEEAARKDANFYGSVYCPAFDPGDGYGFGAARGYEAAEPALLAQLDKCAQQADGALRVWPGALCELLGIANNIRYSKPNPSTTVVRIPPAALKAFGVALVNDPLVWTAITSPDLDYLSAMTGRSGSR